MPPPTLKSTFLWPPNVGRLYLAGAVVSGLDFRSALRAFAKAHQMTPVDEVHKSLQTDCPMEFWVRVPARTLPPGTPVAVSALWRVTRESKFTSPLRPIFDLPPAGPREWAVATRRSASKPLLRHAGIIKDRSSAPGIPRPLVSPANLRYAVGGPVSPGASHFHSK